MKKICECCGKEYNAKRSSSKYCSRECQIKARTKKVKVKCDYCGKLIEVKSCHMKKHEHHFCNSQCRGKWDSLNKTGENSPKYSRVEIKCDYCGKPFIIQKYKLEEGINHYCSRECQHNSLIGRKHTEEYKQKMREITPRGEDSPHWKHDKTDEERERERSYPEYHQWRNEVFERDNYTCQCCGAKNGNGKTVNLNAHHKDGYHWCVERRHDVTNGVTLCTECHNEFHSIYGNRNNTEEQYNEFIENKNQERVS